MNRFLDLNEFDGSPVKTVLTRRPMRIMPTVGQKNILKYIYKNFKVVIMD